MLHIPKNLQFFKDPIFSSLSGCLSKLSCFVRCLKSLTSDGYRFPAPGYIRSKGSEHFLGAELKLTTQEGDELKGELYCVPGPDRLYIF